MRARGDGLAAGAAAARVRARRRPTPAGRRSAISSSCGRMTSMRISSASAWRLTQRLGDLHDRPARAPDPAPARCCARRAPDSPSRVAVVEAARGVGVVRRRQRRHRRRSSAPLAAAHGVVDLVVLVEEQRALGVLLEVERRHCAVALDVQRELARDLHQLAVVDAIRQMAWRGSSCRRRRARTAATAGSAASAAACCAASRYTLTVIELVEQVAHAAHGADVDAERLQLLAHAVHVDLDRVAADVVAEAEQVVDDLLLADDAALARRAAARSARARAPTSSTGWSSWKSRRAARVEAQPAVRHAAAGVVVGRGGSARARAPRTPAGRTAWSCSRRRRGRGRRPDLPACRAP